MKKALVSLVFIFLFVAVVGILFSRWWRSRTSILTFPKILATPVPTSTTLGTLLERMTPLADNEKTVTLSPVGNSTASGLVRYHVEDRKVLFTIFGLLPEDSSKKYQAWVVWGESKQVLGDLHEGKGGWLLDGSLPSEMSPFGFVVGTISSQGKTSPLLEGQLKL